MQLADSTQYDRGADDEPLLKGVLCGNCSFLDFPYQEFGCQQCGAPGDSLALQYIDPIGSVLASAKVNHYTGDDIDAPFVVASIRLAAGPTVRGTMATSSPVSRGTDVVGTFVTTARSEDNDLVAELRFEPGKVAHA